MLTALMAGIFALGGVTLGVALEPVKAKVAFQARQRETRTTRTAAVIQAASDSRAALLWIFRTERVGPPPADDEQRSIENAYWTARNELKRCVLLIKLSGPQELIDEAERVSAIDLKLRRLWFDRPNPKVDRQAVSSTVEEQEHMLEDFVHVARRYT